MSKRIKISLEEINKGKTSPIPAKDIHEANARIKKAMAKFRFRKNRENKEEMLFI